MDLLLVRVHMGAASSLEPVLALLGTLARDLRADFLPLLPRVLECVTQLVESSGRCCVDISRAGGPGNTIRRRRCTRQFMYSDKELSGTAA